MDFEKLITERYSVRSFKPEHLPKEIIDKIIECDKNGMSFEETEAVVREYIKHTHLLFSLKSMNNLARNGRISMAKAKIAGVLGIRAIGIASEIGTLEMLHKCRGEAKNLETILQSMIDTGYEGARAIISHCFNIEAAEKLKALIVEKFRKAKVEITKTGGLCSFYAEDGGLLIGYECK